MILKDIIQAAARSIVGVSRWIVSDHREIANSGSNKELAIED